MAGMCSGHERPLPCPRRFLAKAYIDTYIYTDGHVVCGFKQYTAQMLNCMKGNTGLRSASSNSSFLLSPPFGCCESPLGRPCICWLRPSNLISVDMTDWHRRERDRALCPLHAYVPCGVDFIINCDQTAQMLKIVAGNQQHHH